MHWKNLQRDLLFWPSLWRQSQTIVTLPKSECEIPWPECVRNPGPRNTVLSLLRGGNAAAGSPTLNTNCSLNTTYLLLNVCQAMTLEVQLQELHHRTCGLGSGCVGVSLPVTARNNISLLVLVTVSGPVSHVSFNTSNSKATTPLTEQDVCELRCLGLVVIAV